MIYSISSNPRYLLMEYNFQITNISLFMTQVWFKNRRVKWRKEMRDWCASEKYRFAARFIPPNESPWAAADGHTMATNSQDRGIVSHSSNGLWDDRNQNIIQATSSSQIGNLWLPSKDSNLSKFLIPNDSTVSYNGVNMIFDASMLRPKDLLCGATSSNLQNSTQIPERNVLGNGARITDSSVTRDSLHNGSTIVPDGNILLSGENSSVSQKSTQFSSPVESQGLCNGNSSVLHDGSRLDRGTLQSSPKANTLQNSSRFPNFSKTNVFNQASWTRSEMRDYGMMNTNTWLSFRRESFFQSCRQFPNPAGNKNMNSGADVMRDSSAMRKTSVINDAGLINGGTWLPGDNAIISHNCAQFPGPTEHKPLYKGTSVTHDTSVMRDLDTGVMDGTSWLPDENSTLSQKYIKFSSSTEIEAFHNGTDVTLDNSSLSDASAIRDGDVISESICLPDGNAGFSEICTDHQELSEMHCAGVLCNTGLMCDVQPPFPNLNSLSPTNEGDQIVPGCNRDDAMVPLMNLPVTKTSDLSEDTLNPLCVPRKMKMQDMNDHDSSVLDDLMSIINEEELQNLWC